MDKVARIINKKTGDVDVNYNPITAVIEETDIGQIEYPLVLKGGIDFNSEIKIPSGTCMRIVGLDEDKGMAVLEFVIPNKGTSTIEMSYDDYVSYFVN